jgi:hypothetical protein
MGKWLEEKASSYGFWIFIVVCAYLGYALYFAVYGLNFSISLISDSYVYNLVSQDPWWWRILYYGSEGVSGSVALILRAIGGFFALYSAFLFWRKKDAALNQIRGKVGAALLFEAGGISVFDTLCYRGFRLLLVHGVPLLLRPYTGASSAVRHGHTLPCHGVGYSAAPVEASGKNHAWRFARGNRQVELPHGRGVSVRRVLVQLLHALGSLHGSIPALATAIRNEFSA